MANVDMMIEIDVGKLVHAAQWRWAWLGMARQLGGLGGSKLIWLARAVESARRDRDGAVRLSEESGERRDS